MTFRCFSLIKSLKKPPDIPMAISLNTLKLETNLSFHSPLLKTMLDRRQRFTGDTFHALGPTSQIHSSHDSKEDEEFNFWGARDASYYEELGDQLGGSEIEFQSQARLFEESYGVYLPASWRRETSENDNNESSPLLPQNHNSSNISPLSRNKAIAESRRQLMEMIRDMPESCYELSLKDIVEEQPTSEESEKGTVTEETSFQSEAKPQIKKQKKKNTARQMSRVESMDSKTFLLRMFFPTSLPSKKKGKAGICSKVSPVPSSEGTKHNGDKERWINRFFLSGENKRGRENGMTESTSSRNSSTSSNDDANVKPGCWSFFHFKKNRNKRQKGSIA